MVGSQAVLYSSGVTLTIKPLAPNSKPLQWRGGEGLVSSLAEYWPVIGQHVAPSPNTEL